jgi:GNAT superfamily N-acetyltransferase
LIFSKWLRSLRYGNDYFKLIDPPAYYAAYHRFIQNILNHPDTSVRLAVLSDDADVVLGFSVSRGTILDYVHVHKDQRRQGIGRQLVPKGIDTITHLTRTGLSIWGSKMAGVKFNPFA